MAPELIFDQFVGDVFVVREAGNIAESPTNIGSLEFRSRGVLKSKAIVVLGHSSCGAVQSAFEGAKPGKHSGHRRRDQALESPARPMINDAIVRNVRAVIETVRAASSALLRDAEEGGRSQIVGAVYDIKSAVVRFTVGHAGLIAMRT